jgi:hypothetical protein
VIKNGVMDVDIKEITFLERRNLRILNICRGLFKCIQENGVRLHGMGQYPFFPCTSLITIIPLYHSILKLSAVILQSV